jgi:hypothetical protein
VTVNGSKFPHQAHVHQLTYQRGTVRHFKTNSMASCKPETQAYRNCLKDSRSSGRKCTHSAQTLEACREKWRKENHVKHEFDGTRILLNHKCQPLNKKVQHCLKWKKGDQSQCQEPILALKKCMATEKGILAAPTEGDKIWSDFKGQK